MSEARLLYLKQIKRRQRWIRFFQFSALILTVALWEILARVGFIDSFLMSQPTRVWRTISNFQQNQLFTHIGVTLLETVIGFTAGVALGILTAFILWWSDFLSRVAEPYLVVFNALPKIALGPIIIIWVGAGMQAVIVMALAISLIVTIMEMLAGFKNADPELIKMVKTFGAGRLQTFVKIVFPSSLPTLFNCLKINIGLTLVGVIAGEFLVSRAGLGYLIVFGGQVFQMDLVMTSVIILGIVAALLYRLVALLEWVVLRMLTVN